MAYSIERMPERISIGRETETGVTDVMIDCGAWVSKWPGMTLHAIYTPEGGAPYILQTETDGGVLVWHVTDADTATPGTGSMEIVGEMDGRRKVSATVKVSVAARMSGTVGEPPEAAKPWVDSVIDAAERITGMQAQAKTLDAGSGATAEWDGEQGLLTIGVPKGKDGKNGSDGKDAVVDTTLTQSGQAADAKVTGEALSSKLTEPSTGLAVGKYFRIAAIDESGHAVLEAVDVTGGLSTEPSLWPAWTADEQAAARARMGAYHVDLIGTVETKEEVSTISFDFEARSADRIITIIEMPPVSIAKAMNITIDTYKGKALIIVQFGSTDQSTSQMRCFMSDTILLDRVAVSHNGTKSTNTSVLSGTESVFIADSIDKESILSVKINNPVPLPIGTKVSLYMGA